jgi:alpha-L-fucosidase
MVLVACVFLVAPQPAPAPASTPQSPAPLSCAEWQGENNSAYVDFVKNTEAPQWTYADYAPRFQAEFFNATQWASLFKASGARYIVPTSKHHEGFTMWPSATSFNWNAMDVGPHRDLIGELGAAVKAAGMTFGV